MKRIDVYLMTLKTILTPVLNTFARIFLII